MSATYIEELIEEIEERCYAIRAIEAPHWRWMAGMLVTVRKASGEMREMMLDPLNFSLEGRPSESSDKFCLDRLAL